MAKQGRPFVYQSDSEKPVTVSVRLPRDVYDQVARYVKRHPGMTLTEFFLDGVRLRLDTPADPRDIILSDDNTVMQEVQEMIQTAVQAEIGKLRDFIGPHVSIPGLIATPEAPAEPVPELSHDNNTVLQENGKVAARDTSAQQLDIPDKAALIARLQQMRASGLSLSQIAGQLQAEGVPTLSGKGQWQKGTVDKLLHSQAKRQATAL